MKVFLEILMTDDIMEKIEAKYEHKKLLLLLLLLPVTLTFVTLLCWVSAKCLPRCYVDQVIKRETK